MPAQPNNQPITTNGHTCAFCLKDKHHSMGEWAHITPLWRETHLLRWICYACWRRENGLND